MYTTSMEMFNGQQVLSFEKVEEWKEWLSQNYTLQEGLWIKMARKSTGIPSIDPLTALDVALCYGWIDGQRRSFDENYFLQKYTPRRARSLWSKVNIGKVQALIAAGKMREPGQAEIDRAKVDGRWDAAYESLQNAVIPDDFATALETLPKAKEFFATLDKSSKYSFLWRLMTAKTPEKRTERLQKMVEMLEAGKKF